LQVNTFVSKTHSTNTRQLPLLAIDGMTVACLNLNFSIVAFGAGV
jgi:hypothetical protein